MALEFASRKATFPNYRKFETTFAGRPFVVETGKLCGLANGSAMIRYGETCVLCNVTMSEKPREGVDFFPLSVEFEEKLYAAGRIPGSFMRREGRPGEHAILSSRVVDRPIRPLFPKDMRNDVCVTMTVMSQDPDCSAEISGMNGASLAIAMSDIPWNGPIAGVFVGLVDGEIVLNPTKEQREHSDLSLTLAASEEKIVMIEAGANEVDEETMMKAIRAGHEEIRKMLAFINSIVAEIGKPKKSFTPVELDHALLADVYANHLEDVKAAMNTDDKNVRDAAMLPIMDAIAAEHPELTAADLDLISYKLQKKVVRTWLLEDGKRFVELYKTQYLYMMYVWGHSFEFRTEEDWALMEQFCQLAGGREDTWYATNIEIVDYMADAARLQYTAAGDKVCNPNAQPIGVEVDGRHYEIPAGKTVALV